MTRRALLVALLVVGVLVSAILIGCNKGPGATSVTIAAGTETPVNAPAKAGAPAKAPASSAAQAEEKAAAQGKPGAGELAVGRPTPPNATTEQPSQGLQSSNPDTQLKSLEDLSKSLGSLGGASLQEALKDITGMATDQNNTDQVRAAAAGQLAKYVGTSDELNKVVTKLAHDPSPTIRSAVAASLANPRGGATATSLLDMLTKDHDPGVQAVAVQSQAAFLAASKAPGALGQLISELGNPRGDASAKAGYTLAAKGAEAPLKMLPYLSAAYKTSKNARQRASIMQVITFICMGSNPTQKEFAARAHATHVQLGNLHPAVPQGLPIMVLGLKDPNGYVREAAAQGLGYLGDKRAALPLAKALSDPDPYVRRRAASALGVTPGTVALPALEHAALKDPDADVRRYAVEAVGSMKDPRAVQVLIAATRDPSKSVRRYAATQLGRRHAKAALDALLTLCKDPDPDVRWQTVLAIANLQDKQATNALVDLLNDPSPMVSNAAERALQRLGIARRREKYLLPVHTDG